MPNLTLSEMETMVKIETGLGTTTGGDYKSICDQYLNEGVERFLLLTGCYKKEFSASLTAGEDSYTLSTSILAITDLWGSDSSGARHLDPTTLEEMNAMRLLDSATSGGPCRYYAISGLNLLLLYPAASSGETIKGVYVPRPATLSDASDTPAEIPDEFHGAPVYWAMNRLASSDDDESSGTGQAYKAMFNEEVMLCRRMLKRRGPRPRMGFNTRRRRVLFGRSPSTDMGW